MKIIVEGTKSEVEAIKEILDSVCMFNHNSCEKSLKCDDCEIKHGLIKEFIIKQ